MEETHFSILVMIFFAHNIIYAVVSVIIRKVIEQAEHFLKQKKKEMQYIY